MKYFLIVIIFIVFSPGIKAQTGTASSEKIDSVAQKAIYFLKSKQPDSVYALTGKAFREKITLENFNAITTTKIFPITDFGQVNFISTKQGINKYKISGTPDLQLLVGLDVDGKLQTLLIQEYMPE